MASRFAIIDDPIIMEWTGHYLRCDPLAPRVLGCALAVIYTAGYLIFGSALIALAPCAGFVFVLSEFFFPVHYTVRQNTISAVCVTNLTEVAWSSVGSVRNVKNGVRLDLAVEKSSLAFRVRNMTLYGDNIVCQKLLTFAMERQVQQII